MKFMSRLHNRLICFQVMIDAPEEAPRGQRDRPRALHAQISRVLASNFRSLETGSKADLASVLDRFQASSLFFGTDFPNYPSDLNTVCEKMVEHATGKHRVFNYRIFR
jgi:hypothetical protein